MLILSVTELIYSLFPIKQHWLPMTSVRYIITYLSGTFCRLHLLFLTTVLLVILVCTLIAVTLQLHYLISGIEIEMQECYILSLELRLLTSHTGGARDY
jgi:hypothetical protein